MLSYPPMRTIYSLTLVLLSICLSASGEPISNPIESDIIRSPFHLSWVDKKSSKFDFIFSLETPLKNLNTFETIPPSSLASCAGFPGCLLQNGTFIQSFFNIETSANQLVYRASKPSSSSSPNNSTNPARCEKGDITIHHYCSTHWNPPVHLIGDRCAHAIEWHSPYSCHYNTTNYERPCFVYTQDGRLINLTPWILSDGSSHQIDTSFTNGTVKRFNLNVCNEAQTSCGPNVSACLVDNNNHVESGYNNLTSIKYETKDKSVKLTSLGQYNELCPDKRVKTVIKFVCSHLGDKNFKPKLIRSGPCEYLVEWYTIHACPSEDFQAPATDCAFKYKPLDLSIDFNILTKNSTVVRVPGIEVNGVKKTMLLGLCRGLSSREYQCEGKANSQASACLLDSDANLSKLDASNSKVVGSITKSFFKTDSDRLYLESRASNKSCTTSVGPNFNLTSQLSTVIEFVCSKDDQTKPEYLGFDGCTYLFEWGTRALCVEHVSIERPLEKNQTEITTTTPAPTPSRLADKELKISLESDPKTANQLHKETLNDSKQVSEEEHSSSVSENDRIAGASPKPTTSSSKARGQDAISPAAGPTTAEPKMSKSHKYFMIGLISVTLTAFIVIILVLDKRTRMGLSLTSIRQHARQAMQPQPVPYTRVGQFNDCLDL